MARRSRRGGNPIERGGLGTGMMSELSHELGEGPSAAEQGGVAGSDLQSELRKLDRQAIARTQQERSQQWRAPRLSRTGKLLVGAALTAAAAALYNTYRARRVERRHPPTGRFVTVDGVKLHYVVMGEGPPVVLLHGNVVTAEDFALSGVLERLAAHHRVFAFDRPGFGYSERPRRRMWTPAAQAALLHRALAQLGIERPVVVGHSFGAMVALALALEHPDAVRGLVLLAGYYHPTIRADVPLFAPPAIPVIGDVMRYTLSPLLGRALMPLIIKAMFAPQPVPRRFVQGFPYGMSLRPWQIRAEAQDAAVMVPGAAALAGRFGEIDMPVAVLAGDQDRAIGVGGQSERLHGEIRHSTLRLVPGAGHMVHHTAPEQVAEAVESVAA